MCFRRVEKLEGYPFSAPMHIDFGHASGMCAFVQSPLVERVREFVQYKFFLSGFPLHDYAFIWASEGKGIRVIGDERKDFERFIRTVTYVKKQAIAESIDHSLGEDSNASEDLSAGGSGGVEE